MPAAATARARQLTREEAIEMLNSMPYMVAGSNQRLLRSMYTARDYVRLDKHSREILDKAILQIAFEVAQGVRVYRFESQPFRVIRQITWEEYRAAVPHGARFKFYYEIHSD